ARDRARRRRHARPRAILHALPVAVAVLEVDALPVEPAAVLRDAFAARPRHRQVGVRIVIRAAERDDAERGQRNEHLPLVAPPDLLRPALPDRRGYLAELDELRAARGRAWRPVCARGAR